MAYEVVCFFIKRETNQNVAIKKMINNVFREPYRYADNAKGVKAIQTFGTRMCLLVSQVSSQQVGTNLIIKFALAFLVCKSIPVCLSMKCQNNQIATDMSHVDTTIQFTCAELISVLKWQVLYYNQCSTFNKQCMVLTCTKHI